MDTIRLGQIDYAILIVYTLFVLGIGFALKRYMKTSTDFFLSGRSIPAWIAALAFVSANLGAQEVIGMGACGAKYGMMTCHFYWLGRRGGDGVRGHLHDAVLLRLEGPHRCPSTSSSASTKRPAASTPSPSP